MSAKELERYKRALEVQWDYYGPFGFAAMVAEAGEEFTNLTAKVEPDTLLRKDIALFGTPEEIIGKIMKLKEDVGYEDFMFHTWFELPGFNAAETEAQMQYFAEACMPELYRLCGGRPAHTPDFPIPNFDDVRAGAGQVDNVHFMNPRR